MEDDGDNDGAVEFVGCRVGIGVVGDFVGSVVIVGALEGNVEAEGDSVGALVTVGLTDGSGKELLVGDV